MQLLAVLDIDVLYLKLYGVFFSLQSYIKTSSSGEKSEWSLTVAGRNISYSIVDVGGKQARTLFRLRSSVNSLYKQLLKIPFVIMSLVYNLVL